jgi:diguanylate cyclase (GGDEF)-like protein/PAS domain S-box-containing protein
MKLTGSAFGVLVEYKEMQANILAKAHVDQQPISDARASKILEIKGIWQQIASSEKPIIRNELPGRELKGSDFPVITSLLAVPLRQQNNVAGFIALANKPEPYSAIDLNDVQALFQAFSGVLQRNRLEQSNFHSEKRLKLALDSANEGLWDFTPENDQIYFSPRWYAMLGYSKDELASTMETWHTLTHPEDLPLLKETFQRLIDGEEISFRIEIRMLSQDAKWRWIQVRGSSAARGTDDKATRIVGTLIDISKYKQVELALQKANAELQRLAALDELTQIANRRRFDERLLQEWRRARRDHSPLALVLCDIDYFKLYNDTYGHLKGDETLRAVAQTIQAVLKRSMDLVARFGGEEFAIILPNTDDQGAMRVAQDVKTAVEELRITHGTSKVVPFITCSFGVASLIPVADARPDLLVDRSDKALYQAKADGRNQIVAFSEENFQGILSC